ncbi:MAG: DMT family transporter [Rhizobiaceae bacterium]
MSRISSNALGALFMMLSMAGYVINDVFMKLVLVDLPLFQSIFLRGLFAAVLIFLLCWFMGAFKTEQGIVHALKHKMVLWRILGEVMSTYFFLEALRHMPIANVTAVLQVLPLTITLSAAVFLGEKVGWRRYGAIILGLIGVLIIIRPGAADFNVFAIYALAATVFVTLRDIATRSLPSSTPSLLISLLTAISTLTMGAIGSQFETWQPMEQSHLIHLLGASGIIVVGYIFSIQAMRVGDVGFISVFRYSALIWALLLGYFVFGDVPLVIEIIGALIVVGSGLFSFYRERVIAKTASQKPT